MFVGHAGDNHGTATTPLVIPAKAGIHGLRWRFNQRLQILRPGSAMDSRFSENDKVET